MTYHIFVSGRVQGVGYRRFAQKQAEILSLCGWARNLIDGRVEVMVSGSELVLDGYCEALKRGPLFSQVLKVMVKVAEEARTKEVLSGKGFVVRPDAEIER